MTLVYSLSEMLVTVIECYLRNGNTGGRFGFISQVYFSEGRPYIFEVEVAGETAPFYVTRFKDSWSVRFKNFEALDRSLDEAAYLAVNP
jgi:hypothetical protein